MISYLIKNRDFIIEWLSTVTLIAGVTLTSFNVVPLNLWISLAGNLGWLLLGWMWKKWSLVIVEVVISVIYVAGIYNFYF